MAKSVCFGAKTLNKKYDLYTTPCSAVELLLTHVKLKSAILEPCNGLGNISDIVKKYYDNVYTLDISYDMKANKYCDFLEFNEKRFNTIITNPPFSGNYHCEFIKHALSLLPPGGLAIFLLKLVYIESKKRYQFFIDNPPLKMLVHSERLNFFGGTGIAYAWYIWKKGYQGKTEIYPIIQQENLKK